MSIPDTNTRSIPFFGSMKRVGDSISATTLNLEVRPCHHGYQIFLVAKSYDGDGKETAVEVPSPHIARSAAEARMIVADTLAPFLEVMMVGGFHAVERMH